MLAAGIDGFLLFYELTLILCFSCFILLLFVANKFLLFFLFRHHYSMMHFLNPKPVTVDLPPQLHHLNPALNIV